ncbi:MAG: phosphoribosylaminoimidazolesuccinocarboxamide synthase [Candidatus Rokubacteria bacterium]|nr:phosphoribosylaminoimidazolesuccinocarboxamide synthase [Candidatus Rokubacteria bacterium]
MAVIAETSFPDLSLLRRGKVRDVYAVDRDTLLIVATDRISAFDVVLPNAIPEKGRVLTALSLFWFDLIRDIVPTHLITAEVARYPAPLQKYAAELEGRSMLVRRADVVPFECVARGYLAGSGWKEYQKTGAVCGIPLPPGLKESEKLPRPIFTPATKAETGHDVNVPEADMARAVGAELTATLKRLTLAVYTRAADYATTRGLIIADTKFEFGRIGGKVILVDEVLTPDSSRFWPASEYAPGTSPASFDKQYVRDYLESLTWNKQPPAPTLPPDVVRRTTEKYLEAYRLLTGKAL